MKKLLITACIVIILSLATSLVQAAVQYTVTDLGNFAPTGMNANGDVIGWRGVSSGIYHAVLYSNGTLKDLGTLGGLQSRAFGINDTGQIVGFAQTTDGQFHGFLYQNNTMIDLNTLIAQNSGLTLHGAGAINNNGLIAGICSTDTEKDHIYLLDLSESNSLNHYKVPGAYDVTGINDRGQVIGSYNTPAGSGHGFLLYNGEMTDIFAPDGTNTGIGDINSSGTMVGGFTKSDYNPHAFYYSDGIYTDINGNNKYSTARGINDTGDIVGAGYPDNRIYFYSNNTINDLNPLIYTTLDITINDAYEINDKGQILTSGFYNSDGLGHAFLLTPIPEPSTIMLLGCFAVLSRKMMSCIVERKSGKIKT
jgi:probable HAF family extracellular repeat protein